MSYRDKRHEREAHPGWSVQFSDGSWLGGAHGWFRSDEAFYADIYDTEEEAQQNLKYVKQDKEDKEYFSLDAKVVPAWQPLAEHLRLDIHFLKKANKVSPDQISDIVDVLEQALSTLKETQE